MSFFKKLFFIKSKKTTQGQTEFSEGDIFYVNYGGKYHVYKLLLNDKDFECYHVLGYKPINILPNKANLENLEVRIYHSPVSKNGFRDPKFILNKKITSKDLIGYHEYLRQICEIKDYIPLADNYYQTALRLTDEKKYEDAIDTYSKAIDLIPNFYEAIDNRAFCKMDLAFWKEAIQDFEESLEVNPGSYVAEFSIGECYLRLGNYQKAREGFEKAISIDPNNLSAKAFLEKVNKLLSANQ